MHLKQPEKVISEAFDQVLYRDTNQQKRFLSSLPEAMIFASRLQATLRTQSPCAWKVLSTSPFVIVLFNYLLLLKISLLFYFGTKRLPPTVAAL